MNCVHEWYLTIHPNHPPMHVLPFHLKCYSSSTKPPPPPPTGDPIPDYCVCLLT